MLASPDECARQILEAIPMVMHAIRKEMRNYRGFDLSVPKFRVLIFLNRHEGASLSEIAEHMGLALPSMSKLIDGLVARNMVLRQMDPGDRRRVTLAPTALGRTAMQSALEATAAQLAERLASLSSSGRRTILEATQILESIFGCGRDCKTAPGK
ncbi:MAG: MarR family winged helix-turn-helix transcriptional regulator [Desulfobaccales bacterium]